MRPLEALISQARRGTENDDVGVERGIQDIEFIQYFNDAQDHLQGEIVKHNSTTFYKQVFDDVVGNQDEYVLPVDAFLDNRLVNIDFSHSGNVNDFYPINKRTLRERNSYMYPYINGYILSGNKIILDPIPQVNIVGGLRINYVKKLLDLDVKRFQVSAVTLDAGTSTVTSLTIENLNSVAGDLDETKYNVLLEDNFLTVIDRLGVTKMLKVDFDSINQSTGVVTVNSAFTYDEGESIAVGDFICKGKRSTNRGELDSDIERYLLAYVYWKILKRDSSSDASEAGEEMMALMSDIVDNYKDGTDDIDFVPLIDESFV